MSKDPKTRIGVQNKDDIKSHEFFSDIDWDKLFQRKIMAPIDLIELKNELNNESSILVNLFLLNFYFLIFNSIRLRNL